MKFCPEDGFRLYLKNTEEELLLVCHQCGYEERNEESVIATKHYQKSEERHGEILGRKYLIHDPTYPRTTKIECPNGECPSKEDPSLQVVVLINQADYKLHHICMACNFGWY